MICHDYRVLATGIYNKLQVVTNIILTKPMCQAIINDKFSVGQFMKKYKCWVNLIPYIVLDNNLTADREEIFSTLQKVDEENNGVVLSSIYGREENRCYAKPVIAGKSQYVLSKEEQEVLQQK